MVQLSIKFSDKSLIPKVIDNFKKIFIGLRLKSDGEYYYKRDGDIIIERIPADITDARVAANYMGYKKSSPTIEALGNIGVNDSIIVVNISHAVSDGGLILNAIKHCLDDDLKQAEGVPVLISEAYKKQLEQYKNVDPNELMAHKDCTALTLNANYKNDDDIPLKYFDFELPLSKLKCYDNKDKMVHMLPESYYSAVTLSISAIEKRFNNLSTTICVDLRKFADGIWPKWSFCDHVSIPAISAPNPDMNLSISDINKQFRKTCDNLISKGAYLYQTLQDYTTNFPKSCITNISNIGNLKIQDPFEDIVVQTINKGNGTEEMLYYLFYTISKPKENFDKFVSRFRFSKTVVPLETGCVLNESLKHLLTEVPYDIPLIEVYNELIDFQDKVRKNCK